MLFITTVSGRVYEMYAEFLCRSMLLYDWPPLIVARACDYKHLDTLWRGRGLKTRFSEFIPEKYEGPVTFLDADCIVTGPYEDQECFPEESITCTLRYNRRPDSMRRSTWLPIASTMLTFSDVPTAKKVCAKWYGFLEEIYKRRVGTDEIALRYALHGLKIIPRGTITKPFKNLQHLSIPKCFSHGRYHRTFDKLASS